MVAAAMAARASCWRRPAWKTLSVRELSSGDEAPDTQADACYVTREVTGEMQTGASIPTLRKKAASLESSLPLPTLGSRLFVQN